MPNAQIGIYSVYPINLFIHLSLYLLIYFMFMFCVHVRATDVLPPSRVPTFVRRPRGGGLGHDGGVGVLVVLARDAGQVLPNALRYRPGVLRLSGLHHLTLLQVPRDLTSQPGRHRPTPRAHPSSGPAHRRSPHCEENAGAETNADNIQTSDNTDQMKL